MEFHGVDVGTQFKRMRELVPEAYRAFLEFDQKAFKDGAIPGKMAVSVLSTEEVPSKTGGDPEIRYLIPEKFASPNRSGVQVEVPARGDDAIRVDLQ